MGDRKAVLILALVLVVLLLQVPNAHSEEPTVEDKLSDFLSGVVGLDMAKYTLVPPSLPPGVEIPSDPASLPPPVLPFHDPYGGLVEEVILSPDFEYNENHVHIMATFRNGHMTFFNIDPQGGDYVYSESPPIDIFSQAKSIIQRYQTFASQNYDNDTSYVVPMQNLLNSVDDLSPTEITEGNVTLKIWTSRYLAYTPVDTHVQWIYTEGGISMERKRVGISFHGDTFVGFTDTWGLYSVSGLGVISSEEAVQIALEAAQKCELRIGHEDRETEIVKVPDLSNAPYNVNLYMVPYSYEESDLPSNTTRDPLTLYPYWQVHFYFNESIAGCVGVQVGVYGDTSEIIYCSGFGYLGTSGPTNEQDITTLQPDDQSLDEQKQPNPLNPTTLAVAASLAAVLIISISIFLIWRKKRYK